MKQKRYFILMICFITHSAYLAFSGVPKQAPPESVGMSAQKLKKIDDLMQSYIDLDQISGAVTLVARHGQVVQFKAYGNADDENNLPMTEDNIFRIFSMTKQITAVAVLMLWEDGKFSISDPVSKYIPEFANPQVLLPCGEGVGDCEGDYKLEPAHREITIADLLAHTSGITYVFNSRPFLTEIYKNAGIGDGLKQTTGTIGDMVKKLAKLPLYGHPGEVYEYGLSMDVAGYLVEVVSGKNLGDFCQERIFGPLGMTDTGFWLPQDKIARLPAAYSLDEHLNRFRMPNGVSDFGDFSYSPDFHYNGPQTYYSGGAGAYSTTWDYAKLLIMLANDGMYDGHSYLGKNTILAMRRDQTGGLPGVFLPGYGMGLGPAVHVDGTASRRNSTLSEWRWAGLFNTWFQVDHEEGLVSIIMSQLWPYFGIDAEMEGRFHAIVNGAIISSPGKPIDFKR